MERASIWILVVAVLGSVGTASSCGWFEWDANSDFCCVTREVCVAGGKEDGLPVPCIDPDRPICDEEHGRCVADSTRPGCEESSDCSDADRPLCVDGECRECDGTTGCDASAPVCDVGGTHTCGGCEVDAECSDYAASPRCDATSGACVECLTSADDCFDQEQPICGSDHRCRACEADDECESGICDEPSGSCVSEVDIVYVDSTGSGSECTRAMPCPTITAGVAAVADSRTYVLVAAGSYSEFVTIEDKSLTLVGLGADLSATTAGALFTVRGAANVIIEGLRLHDALGAASGDGIRCALDGADAPTLALTGVTIDTNARRGVESSDCTLAIERSTISGNQGGGVSVTGGRAAMVNNMIIRNGGLSSTIGGVMLESITALSFEFNTVADNATLGTDFAPGIQCRATTPVLLANSIVHGSAADQIGSPIQCAFSYSFSNQELPGSNNRTGDPGFVDPTKRDYHLQAPSPCVDAADPAATLAIDVDGDPRPQSAGRDIGADERVP